MQEYVEAMCETDAVGLLGRVEKLLYEHLARHLVLDEYEDAYVIIDMMQMLCLV